MSVNATSAASFGTINNTRQTGSSSSLTQQDFLKILVAQMTNQNPMEPTSNTEFLAQMAQFALLESFQSLSANFSANQAYSMIGKYVYVQDSAGMVFGKVDGIVNEKGINYVMIGGETYNAALVAGVMDAGAVEANLDDKILQGANLIGKTVTATIKDENQNNITVTGTVSKLIIQANSLYAVVDGQNISISDITEIA